MSEHGASGTASPRATAVSRILARIVRVLDDDADTGPPENAHKGRLAFEQIERVLRTIPDGLALPQVTASREGEAGATWVLSGGVADILVTGDEPVSWFVRIEDRYPASGQVDSCDAEGIRAMLDGIALFVQKYARATVVAA